MGKKYVVSGATLECMMGSTSNKLNIVLPHTLYINNKSIANTGDCKPFVNVMSFGTCKMIPTQSGPGPCAPAFMPCWVNGIMNFMIDGMPALYEDSILSCALGGIIKIKDSGQ